MKAGGCLRLGRVLQTHRRNYGIRHAGEPLRPAGISQCLEEPFLFAVEHPVERPLRPLVRFNRQRPERNRLARLDNDSATESLTIPTINRVQWLRGGAAPEAQRVIFQISGDAGAPWTNLGPGSRITDAAGQMLVGVKNGDAGSDYAPAKWFKA